MALEVRHIKIDNPDENKQFRRVARQLIQFFEQQNWDGLLIGNPESENCQGFRADAILLYNYGLVLIDFKEYSGTIDLPRKEEEFDKKNWYIDTEDDKKRIIIKAGCHFSNPFRQLYVYRGNFIPLVRSDITLSNKINPNHICILNVFSGPIKLNGQIPGKLKKFYSLTTEEDLLDFLVDYNSSNSYSEEAHFGLLKHFPSELWNAHNVIETEEPIKVSSSLTEIDGDLEAALNNFLSTESSGLLVLKSTDTAKRDDWMKYILENGNTYNSPQIETWVHSTRIARRVKARSEIGVTSIYANIYGGRSLNEDEEAQGNEQNKVETDELNKVADTDIGIDTNGQDENQEELEIEEIPIASDADLDEKAVIIIQDAHLVTSSVHRSDLLLFGSGKVLTDLIRFMRLDSNKRKIIFIGDPYSLSYGKLSESALVESHLATLYTGRIQSYKDTVDRHPQDGIEGIRGKLASAIQNKTFNKLSYPDDDNEVMPIEVETAHSYFLEWFSLPSNSEPKNVGLFYKRESAYKANLQIKEHYLKNTHKLNSGDLLLVDNNVWVPDDTGFTSPLKIFNGMYVRVEEVLEEKAVPITRKGRNENILLEFVKIKVCCISLESKPVLELWLNKNYFDRLGKLSNQELLAYRIFRSIRLSDYKKKYPFESSFPFKKLNEDDGFIRTNEEIKELEGRLEAGEKVKTKLEETKRKSRRIERRYKKEYNNEASYHILRNDPFVNAINAGYGWCITVHKAVGAQFNEVVFNVNKGLNQGIINEDYFRWVYSGMTTAIEKVYITNSNEIDPFMNCTFEDLAEEGWLKSSKPLNNSIEFKGFKTPVEYAGKIEEDLNSNVKGAIVHFSNVIASEGILLERTRKIGDYLSKAFFSTPNGPQELIMVFNNNGKGHVTSIRIERNGASYQALINKAISEVKDKARKEDTDVKCTEIPEDFRKDVYEDWMNRAQASGAQLKLEGCHSYHDILIYSKGGQKIKFKLIYNGKGMFSHLKVLAKTDPNISIELYELVFNGD